MPFDLLVQVGIDLARNEVKTLEEIGFLLWNSENVPFKCSLGPLVLPWLIVMKSNPKKGPLDLDAWPKVRNGKTIKWFVVSKFSSQHKTYGK